MSASHAVLLREHLPDGDAAPPFDDGEGVEIGILREGLRHQVRVAKVRDERGRPEYDVRVWRRRDDGVTFHPTSHGLRLSRSQVQRLLHILAAAVGPERMPPALPAGGTPNASQENGR